MTITVTKYRPDCTPIKQVFIDFEDDTLFDPDEDELDFDMDEVNCEECEGCPGMAACDDNELDGQMSIKDIINLLTREENNPTGCRGSWTINFKN